MDTWGVANCYNPDVTPALYPDPNAQGPMGRSWASRPSAAVAHAPNFTCKVKIAGRGIMFGFVSILFLADNKYLILSKLISLNLGGKLPLCY